VTFDDYNRSSKRLKTDRKLIFSIWYFIYCYFSKYTFIYCDYKRLQLFCQWLFCKSSEVMVFFRKLSRLARNQVFVVKDDAPQKHK